MTSRARSARVDCIATFRAIPRVLTATWWGLGVSAISKIGPTYSQNVRTIEEYYDRLKLGMLPTARGIALDRDDILRARGDHGR